MFFSKQKREPAVDFDRLPTHIGIIMDGNGRWANARGLPRPAGHAAGAEAFRRIANYSKEIGLRYLTVYAFSTENWSRPADEVSAIMNLLRKYLAEAIEKVQRDRVRMCFFGELDALPGDLRDLCRRTEEASRRFDGVQVNICINYGGRGEILRAARAFAADCAAGRAEAGRLDEQGFGTYLYTAGVPDPDLIIRPSGELRTSNFLVFQAAYSELYFTDVLWPDFGPAELRRAIAAYQQRQRRFGGV